MKKFNLKNSFAEFSNNKPYKRNGFEVLASSIGRITEHMFLNPFAIISAERDEYTKKENRARSTRLKIDVRDLGLGFIKTKGAWKYEDGTYVKEDSIFIPLITKEEALRLGRKYDQEAIIIGENGKYRLVHCETGDTIGKEENIAEAIRFPKTKENPAYYSQLLNGIDNNTHRFILESTNDSIASLILEAYSKGISEDQRQAIFQNSLEQNQMELSGNTPNITRIVDAAQEISKLPTNEDSLETLVNSILHSIGIYDLNAQEKKMSADRFVEYFKELESLKKGKESIAIRVFENPVAMTKISQFVKEEDEITNSLFSNLLVYLPLSLN